MGYYGGGMMGNWSWGIFGVITWLIVLIDLILFGVWLWKQIKK